MFGISITTSIISINENDTIKGEKPNIARGGR